MSTESTKTPLCWITYTIVGLFTFISSTILFKKEIIKRKSGEPSFTTKYLKMWSITCICLGFIIGFDLFVYWIHGFCYISDWIFFIGMFYQIIFMGFYQLSRLYYCFAQNQVYSNKGYPNVVFIIMYSIGVIFMILIIPFTFNSETIDYCGIDENGCIVNK